MTEPSSQQADRDFSRLPERVRPKDMVEMHQVEELNEIAAPAGDPDRESFLRNAG